jgi:hypothetical protein
VLVVPPSRAEPEADTPPPPSLPRTSRCGPLSNPGYPEYRAGIRTRWCSVYIVTCMRGTVKGVWIGGSIY